MDEPNHGPAIGERLEQKEKFSKIEFFTGINKFLVLVHIGQLLKNNRNKTKKKSRNNKMRKIPLNSNLIHGKTSQE